MTLIKKPMRYAHPEGHTDVCYHTGGNTGLVTCGADGDVRAWVNLMDDDPTASCISEQATVVISKNGKLYVGNDNNTVQILSHPDLEKEGILTRFSSTVSAIASSRKSNLIATGACDMRIQVIDINKAENIELEGHEAPILGLSLDPKEEFLASSSADGSIRVWDLKEKKVVHTWYAVPKCNSFFTAKVYCMPSFHCKTGEYLAYPQGKEVVVVKRSSWEQAFKLKSLNLKTEISICKFSECGTYIAASSTYGEIVVWEVETKEEVGYTEHQQNAKITSLVWHPKGPTELAFCDSLGQLGCVEVVLSRKSLDDLLPVPVTSEAANGDDAMIDDYHDDDDDDDDDDENVISLNKIKASVEANDDDRSVSDASEKKYSESKKAVPEFDLQEPFQPGSTPSHLLSRYMVWNDTGIVSCYTSEDKEGSSIEVEFHDITIHHSMHINNFLKHDIAALSPQALALACRSSDDSPSKLVVVALQGWGSGNKEWTADLPDGEEADAVAAGDNFVAVATSLRTLRIFMAGGTQREVIALPGPVVAMNGFKNQLLVIYHAGLGAFGDQNLNLLWIRVCGPYLRSQTIKVPLSPASNLMWLGFTDQSSPVVMDAEGVINIFDQKSALWRVACDTSRRAKGKFDNYFIIGVSETDQIIRCILCKGSHYPPTTPRPIVTEIPLLIPLCDPSNEKSEGEAKIWQMGRTPDDEKESVLRLIALACRHNVEFRAVELCQQLASQKVMELAIKYAGHMKRIALANKLESIADAKEPDDTLLKGPNPNDEFRNDFESTDDDVNLPLLSTPKSTEIEIRPLTPSQHFGRRSNPFLKKARNSTPTGLAALNRVDEPQKATLPSPAENKQASKQKKLNVSQTKETFVSWFSKNKKTMEEELPDYSSKQLTATAFGRYKNMINGSGSSTEDSSKKRKLSTDESDDNTPKRSISSKFSEFTRM